MKIAVSGMFALAVVLLVALSTPAQDKVVVVPLGGAVGDATPADVLEGKTFSSREGKGLVGTLVSSGITEEVDPTVDASVKDGVSWNEVSGKPAGFADNVDNTGIMSESDPTVNASVKDGVSWDEVSGKPAGFADNVDNTGIMSESDPTVNASVKDGVSWNEVSGKPAGFADNVDNDSGGDITSVTAGFGLTGGGATGAVTLNVDIPVYTAVNSSLIGGNSSTYYDATCAPDYTAVGGGFDHFAGLNGGRTRDIHAFVNYPANAITWRVGLRNDTSTVYNVEVYAICLRLD